MSCKVKDCYGCPADGIDCCLLGYDRILKYEYFIGPKGGGHHKVYSPKECCHKPKTIKEFTKTYYPLTPCTSSMDKEWKWLDGKWPWESEKNV